MKYLALACMLSLAIAMPASGRMLPAGGSSHGDRTGGDTVASAYPIPGLPFTDTGTTCGFANDYDAVCPYTGSTAPDVVYGYTPPTDQYVTIDLCGSTYDTKVYVFENTVGNVIACNDDYCNYQSFLSQVPFAAGNTYYIIVDGYAASCGFYVLQMMDLTRAPIAHWSFDEGSGAVVHDSSPFGNHGTQVGCEWVAGVSGTGLRIHDDTAAVRGIPQTVDNLITSAFTVACWVNWEGVPPSGHSCYIYDARSAASGTHLQIDSDGKAMLAYLSNGFNQVTGVTSIVPGEWTHIAGTLDASEHILKIYINGVLDETAVAPSPFSGTNLSAAIGNNRWVDGNYRPLHGVVDDLRIYSFAMTADEIGALIGPSAIAGGGRLGDGTLRLESISPSVLGTRRGQTEATVTFRLDSAGWTSLAIHDLQGRQVDTVLSGERPAGVGRAVWNAAGHTSGVYFCRLTAGGVSSTQTVVVLN